MRGIHDFIIEMKVDFHDTFKTESGLELYANKDISQDRLSNRIAKIVSTPLLTKTEIKKGYEVMIDPSIVYKQIYKGIKQESIHLMDKQKKWYKIEMNGIILYRETHESEWKAFRNNNLVEPVKTKNNKVISSVIFIPEDTTKTIVKGRAKALYMNSSIEAKKGDELVINKNGGLPYWINGKEYWWLRNRDIYAIVK